MTPIWEYNIEEITDFKEIILTFFISKNIFE